MVPLDEQSNTLRLTQPVDQSDVTTVVSTAADLSTGLQVLTSVSSNLDTEQRQLPQELTVKQVEAMLNQSMISVLSILLYFEFFLILFPVVILTIIINIIRDAHVTLVTMFS